MKAGGIHKFLSVVCLAMFRSIAILLIQPPCWCPPKSSLGPGVGPNPTQLKHVQNLLARPGNWIQTNLKRRIAP